MRSESTSALGQPSETKPTVGVLRFREEARPPPEAVCGFVAWITAGAWLKNANQPQGSLGARRPPFEREETVTTERSIRFAIPPLPPVEKEKDGVVLLLCDLCVLRGKKALGMTSMAFRLRASCPHPSLRRGVCRRDPAGSRRDRRTGT